MLKQRLWFLIQDEAEAVKGYEEMLGVLDDEDDEGGVVRDVLTRIIADERDHLAALTYLYDHFNGVKATTETVDLAKRRVAEQKEARRLIK